MPAIIGAVLIGALMCAWFLVVCFIIGLIHHVIGSIIQWIIPKRAPVEQPVTPQPAPVTRKGHAGKRQTLRGY